MNSKDEELLEQVREIMVKYKYQCRDMADEIIAACKSTLESEESIAKVSYDNLNNIGWNPNLKELPADGTPLYLHPLYPRPAKRLSDDAKLSIIRKWKESKTMREQELIGLCDLIEAAHGIKS